MVTINLRALWIIEELPSEGSCENADVYICADSLLSAGYCKQEGVAAQQDRQSVVSQGPKRPQIKSIFIEFPQIVFGKSEIPRCRRPKCLRILTFTCF